jgi:hypothetical protein
MKPVAYMTKDGYVYGQHETRPVDADIPLYTHKPIAYAELGEGESIPLYEHPMRELTDAEIQELYHSKPRFDVLGNFGYLNFARAILKKAREK